MKALIYQDWGIRAICEDIKTMTRRLVKVNCNIVRKATPEEWNSGRAHPNMRRFED